MNISDLAIQNVLARGGAGATGTYQTGGGGLGAGGAVFIGENGNVTLTGVDVSGAVAQGGTGGDGDSLGGGAGGCLDGDGGAGGDGGGGGIFFTDGNDNPNYDSFAGSVAYGTLLVDGSTAADSFVTADEGATLGGGGTVNDAAKIYGTISASELDSATADSIGTFNTGALELYGGTLRENLTSTATDRVNADGVTLVTEPSVFTLSNGVECWALPHFW